MIKLKRNYSATKLQLMLVYFYRIQQLKLPERVLKCLQIVVHVEKEYGQVACIVNRRVGHYENNVVNVRLVARSLVQPENWNVHAAVAQVPEQLLVELGIRAERVEARQVELGLVSFA
jgi:hypothetical protein